MDIYFIIKCLCAFLLILCTYGIIIQVWFGEDEYEEQLRELSRKEKMSQINENDIRCNY
jgi:hypothetical protein